MTTMYPEVQTCDNCGASTEVMVVGSTSSFGYMDLDTRPPELMRFNLPLEINHCDACGYCAPDFGVGATVPSDVLASEEYKAELQRDGVSETARWFSCAGLIAEADKRFADAGWMYLKGAWACDDAEDNEGATRARQKALSAWAEASRRGESFGADAESELLITVDVMRRAGRFDEAEHLASGFSTEDQFLTELMALEVRLIRAGDSLAHTIESAVQGLA